MQKISNQNIKEWIIPLSCILLQYEFYISSIGVIILFFCVINTFLKKGRIKLNKNFFILAIIIALCQIILVLNQQYSLSNYVKDIGNIFLIILVFSVANEDIDKEKVYKNYRKIGISCCIVIFIQTFQMIVLNQTVGAIPILPLMNDSYWYTQYNRPSAFFTEPQVFCSYMFPLLIMAYSRKHLKTAILISVAMICSTSSMGILISSLLLINEIIRLDILSLKRLTIIIFLVISFICFMNAKELEVVREKVFSIVNSYEEYSNTTKSYLESPSSYSNYLRLLKAKDTFVEMPFEHKILGVGNHNLKNYIYNNNLWFSWMNIWSTSSKNMEYMSSFIGVIIYYGIIVGFIYYILITKMFIKSNYVQKSILLLLIFQSFTTQIFFNGLFIYYFLMVFVEKKYKTKDYITVKM